MIDEARKVMADVTAIKLALARVIAELSAGNSDRETYIRKIYSLPRAIEADGPEGDTAKAINLALQEIEEAALAFALGKSGPPQSVE